MTMWIEIWKKGTKVVHSYEPMWEIENKIKELGKITNYEIKEIEPNIKNIKINNKTFYCILTCTTQQSKSIIKMLAHQINI